MTPPYIRQAWIVLAVLVNMIGQGMLLSYPTCLLPALQQPDSTIKADLLTASWLVSSTGLSGIPGFQISSVLMNIYGRKLTHVLVVVPGIVGWITIYFAQNITMLMFGRICGGISTGASVALGAIVIGEYSDPKYRGVFLNLKTTSVNIGSMLVHILGHFLSWRNLALISVFPYVISFLITFTWPESPPWLASKGMFNESKKSFFWLRENTEASNKELEELLKAQREKLSKPKVKKSFSDNLSKYLTKFTKRDFVKPLLIMIVSTILLEASGRHIFPAYALQIIDEVSGSKSQSFYYTLGIDIIITISTLCSSILVKIMRRRILLFSTGFAAFAVLMIACTYLTLTASGTITKNQPWLAIGLFVLYFILANLGCTPIPLALLGEVFPLQHRGVGSAIVGICMSLCVMIGLQITPYLLINVKIYGSFFIFGTTLVLMLSILYFILPETKDKTLQEIEDYFNNGKFRDDEQDKDIGIKFMN